jgi:uroporphyrin-III C-methyltransferase
MKVHAFMIGTPQEEREITNIKIIFAGVPFPPIFCFLCAEPRCMSTKVLPFALTAIIPCEHTSFHLYQRDKSRIFREVRKGYVSGKVFIVGAGPGDPRLITVWGLECLRAADAVVYDRLVDPTLLDEAPGDAMRFYVGKEPRRHPWPQEKINELLAEHALAGRTVVRLKGGDPFVFGRGGEEASFLAQKGIAFEIVPGISSPLAVPALAGIPVTHRGISNAFAVATGHPCARGSEPDFLSLFRAAGTLVILMGVERRTEIARSLIEGHVNPATPVALIERGGSAGQRITITDLANIGADCASVQPPAVIVVGRVVSLMDAIRGKSAGRRSN